MNYLSIEQLSKSFGAKKLFNHISFGIARGEKVALVARNGAGKSTLLRIISGSEIADEGKVVFKKDIRIAYLSQDPDMSIPMTVLNYVLSDDSPTLQAVKKYEVALEKYSTNPDDANQRLLEEATSLMEYNNAWDAELRVKQILSQLNIHNLELDVTKLSGGQKKRVALCKVLIDLPDLIIMDEPTNHLDLDMIEWLENYLIRSDVTLLLVTHDRYFLDRICNRIVELDDNTIYTYDGNYEYFLEKKAERKAIENAEIEKAQNTMRKELDWIRRMPKARTTKSKSRIDAFYELKERATKKKIERELELQVKMSRLGNKIIELKDVCKSYGELNLIDHFNYIFKAGERIGIVGPNGVGKSTFLNVIMGLEELSSGKIEHGDTVIFGYYSQQGLKLKEDMRVIEVIKEVAEHIELNNNTSVSASQLLNMFLFTNEMQYSLVSKLSGGERKRLYLCRILMKNPNFLVLDEPTNDLDLATLQILEDFLLKFRGCLIIVSHDRYFMDKLTEHLFVFEGKGLIRDFWGNYSEYRDEETVKTEEKELESFIKQENKPLEVENSASIKRKLSYIEKKELEGIDKEIEKLEAEKGRLTAELNSGMHEHHKLTELATQITNLDKQINAKTERWIELQELSQN
jgi:ATP-binding cassette subfamily F protein uup